VTVERRFGTPGVGTVPDIELKALMEKAGASIVLGDQVTPVPQGDPLHGVLEHLVAYNAVGTVRDKAARDAVRRAAMQEVAAFAQGEIERIDHVESPPKRVDDPTGPVPRMNEH